jgi:hypothetical protein
MKKKLIIGILIVVLAGAGYLIADHLRVHVPQLKQGFGIWESEMEIVANPGGTNIATLTIINGKDQDRVFYITLEQPNPDKLQPNYEPFPAANYGWFTVPESAIDIAAGKYYQLQIPISIPYNTTYLNRNAELRVQVTASDSTGLVQLALQSRWYIVVTEE